MRIAHELGKDEDEVIKWHPDKFARWVAYLNIQEKEKAKAARQAARAARRGIKPPPNG